MPISPEEDGKVTTKEIIFLAVAILFIIILFLASYGADEPKALGKESSRQSSGWASTKNVLYDVIYKGHNIDLYYGCKYKDITHVDFSSCNLPANVKEKKRSTWIEAEHIVPASLLPARQFECWIKEKRKGCEEHDPKAQAMIYDLHNLAPAVGQVNADRGNRRYGEEGTIDKSGQHAFEPNDCVKGDVARTWLFMHNQYGVMLVPGEEDMFERWSKADPVSPWESERDKRIKKYTFVDNPYVKGQTPDPKGACPWEK